VPDDLQDIGELLNLGPTHTLHLLRELDISDARPSAGPSKMV